MAQAILTAQQHLLDAGLINLVVLDASASIIACQGPLVQAWVPGDNVIEKLFVLTGMEELIAMMADSDADLAPIELPAVFLGGNHEDGEPGVSLRLSSLAEGQVLLLLRPLESTGAMDQISVQQHNDLALLRGQLERAQSQAELNVEARDSLFDALRWGFRAPLATLHQTLLETEFEPQSGAALTALDQWLDLLALKTQLVSSEAKAEASLSALAVSKEVEERSAKVLKLNQHAETAEFLGAARLPGAGDVLVKGLVALFSCVPDTSADFGVSLDGAKVSWSIDLGEAVLATTSDHRFELARTAAVILGGSLSIEQGQAILSLPVQPT